MEAPKYYIDKAQWIYDGILTYDNDIYTFFINYILNVFNINSNKKLYILDQLIGRKAGGEYLKYKITEKEDEDKFDFEFEFKDEKVEKDDSFDILEFLELKENSKVKIEEDEKNRFCFFCLLATNEIYNKHFKNASDSTIVEVDLNKNENLRDCNFKKFCTYYTCKTNTIKAKGYAEALALSFYVYLWKSICVGEFISVEDYAKRLKIVNKKEDETRNYAPIPDLAFEYQSIIKMHSMFMNRISYHIDDKSTSNSCYEIHSSVTDILTFYRTDCDYISTRMLPNLMELTHYIYEMTVLDLRYVASIKSVSTLSTLILSLESLRKSSLSYNQDILTKIGMLMPKTTNENMFGMLKNVIDALQFKSSVLIRQIIDQKTPDAEIGIRFKLTSDELAELITSHSIKKYNLKSESSFHQLYKKKTADETIINNIRKKLYQCEAYRESKPSIYKYNSYIKRGFEAYVKYNEYYMALINNKDDKEIISTIKKFVNYEKDLSEISPSLFVKQIIWLYEYIQREDVDRSKVSFKHQNVHLFGKLLNKLRDFIIKFKSEDGVPYRLRPCFEYSFCRYDGKKYIHKHDTIYKDIPNEALFFASLNYTPLNIKFLDNFFLKYNRIYKVLESSFTDRAIEETEKATVEAVEASNAARNERGKTLQLVGLFGCFIAFVSSVVGTHRVATGIYEFILFSFTFTICILVFLICFDKIIWSKPVNEENITERGKDYSAFLSDKFVLVAVLLAIILFIIIYFRESILYKLIPF